MATKINPRRQKIYNLPGLTFASILIYSDNSGYAFNNWQCQPRIQRCHHISTTGGDKSKGGAMEFVECFNLFAPIRLGLRFLTSKPVIFTKV